VPEKRYRRAVELMEAALDDELVALDAARGECFGFNAPAAAVWRHLEESKTFEQLREKLLREFDVSDEQCSAELTELLQDMRAKGLVELA
jgi:hypothetical protein